MEQPLLYTAARLLVRLALRIYFRKIELTGRDHVPRSGPVIPAANHPQSITDALILGAVMSRMVHCIGHSGLFRNRAVGWLLRQLGAIPVFRPQDITGAQEKNLATFAACTDLLLRGGVLGIFPEGTSVDEPRLQKLKTGTARIALQAESAGNWTLGLQMVPVGLHFESSQRFRSRVLVAFGTPIPVASYRDRYAGDPTACVIALTTQLHDSLRGLVVDLEHEQFAELVGDVESVYKDELLAREGLDIPGDSRFQRDRWLSRQIPRALDYFFERDPEIIWRTTRLMGEYRRRLNSLKLKDEVLRAERGDSIPGAAARFVVHGAPGLPLAAYGVLWNYLPYNLTGWLAGHFARDPTKIHATRLAIGAPLYAAYYGALLYWILESRAAWATAVFAASLPVSGIFARIYARRMAARRDRIRLGFRELSHGYAVRVLRQQRRRLIQELDRAAAEFVRAQQPQVRSGGR